MCSSFSRVAILVIVIKKTQFIEMVRLFALQTCLCFIDHGSLQDKLHMC